MRAPAIRPELLSPTLSARALESDFDISDDEGHEHGERQFGPYNREQLVRSLKAQVWSGALLGLAAAAAVGAIFLYVVSLVPTSVIATLLRSRTAFLGYDRTDSDTTVLHLRSRPLARG